MDVLIYPLIGGVLIGLSAGFYYLFLGRIAGVSGLFARCMSLKGKRDFLGAYFITGLVLSGVLFRILRPEYFNFDGLDQPLYLMGFAGFFVGFGTVWGNGCTSGHGVCGIGRFSKRSIISTCVFMGVAILVVTFKKWMLGV